jgi:hypothetical protein
VFGDDYSTPKRFGVSHLSALEYLRAGGKERGAELRVWKWVLGSGTDVPVHFCPRRCRGPPVLVAQVNRIGEVLGWYFRYNDLRAIVRHALGGASSSVAHQFGGSVLSFQGAALPPRFLLSRSLPPGTCADEASEPMIFASGPDLGAPREFVQDEILESMHELLLFRSSRRCGWLGTRLGCSTPRRYRNRLIDLLSCKRQALIEQQVQALIEQQVFSGAFTLRLSR